MKDPGSTIDSVKGPLIQPTGRISQLDYLRGFVMVTMAIDHAALFVASRHPNEWWDVIMPVYSSFIEFFTRAVSHVSAPGFFLLMGAGIALFHESRKARGWSMPRIIRFFMIRGVILFLVNQIIETPAFTISIATSDPEALWPYQEFPEIVEPIYLQTGVLTALGICMIIAGLLSNLSSRVLVVLGLVAMIVSQMLTPDYSQVNEEFGAFMRLLVVSGGRRGVFVVYPVLPWLGVTLCGMVFGRQARKAPQSLSGLCLRLGGALLILFVILRAASGFGNIHPAAGNSIIEFLNVTKYPPSLTFLSLWLGVIFVVSAFLSRLPDRITGILDVYGKSPLFFYVVHLYVYALIAIPFPMGTGYPMLYAAWLVGLIPLFFACRRYTAFKLSKSPESLWRLF